MEGYITIEGADHILNKMKNLLITAEDRVYISCTRNYLLLLVEELDQLIAKMCIRDRRSSGPQSQPLLRPEEGRP